MPAATDITTPLWRAVVVLRILTATFAIGSIIVDHDDFVRPELGWAVLAGIAVWTVVTCLAYSHDVSRRIHVIVLDLLMTLALTASSVLVLSPVHLGDLTAGAPLLTTVWSSGPVLAAAVHAGRLAGALFAIAVCVVDVWVRGFVTTTLLGQTVLLAGTGFMLGSSATTARRAMEQSRRAARAEAATAERERLARSVCDGALQALALVRSRGERLGGEATELIRLAGEQESALRSLVWPATSGAAGRDEEDLASALRSLASSWVDVAVPATEVPLPASDVEELVAVAREVLAGAAHHAGPDTRAWVLVKDLGEEVVLTVRGDGPGLDDAHVADTEPASGTGTSRSIRGRVADLGATLTLDTGPGQGTAWEVRLARTRSEL